ncbi:MAG TPA: hypothetical protein VIS96_11575 [Terrimicrobiaceae bacterium]
MLSKPALEVSAALTFSGKLSAPYSSGLADERWWNERGWKRGRRLGPTLRAIQAPIREEIQSDGRIRRWVRIPEFENRALRVILLPDAKRVHNAFFDRDFTD